MPSYAELQAQAYKVVLNREKLYQREVAKTLLDSLVVMRGEMAGIYEKYAIDGKLTNAQMTKYNRYVTMEKQMLATLDPAIRANLVTIKRLTPEQYEAAFFRQAWAMDNGNGVRLGYGTINRSVIAATLENEFSKIAYKRYVDGSKLLIRSALNEGLAAGKSYQKMSRDLKKAMNTTYQNALRIIETEGQTAVNAGQDALYLRAQQEGIEGKQIWDSTLDSRTRQTHQRMDGKEKKEDGKYNGPGSERAPYPGWAGLSAKERIRCRCHERFQVEGYEPQIRRSREQGIIPYQTYPEWEKNYKPKAVK